MTPHSDLHTEAEHAARRRALLDSALRDPDDAAARRALAGHVAEAGRPAGRPPHAAGIGLLALVAAGCAVLALLALLAGMDVTAALLAVAGFYTVWMIRRRRG